MELSLTDRRILFELDRDARIPLTQLGKRVRLSKEAVRQRIKKLEAEGAIAGYYAVIDQAKLGQRIFRVYIRQQSISPSSENNFIKFLCSQKRVWLLGVVSGPFHLVISVWAKNTYDFLNFWKELLDKHHSYIGWYQINEITHYVEFGRSYLLPEKEEEKAAFETLSASEPVRVDKTDLRLLEALAKEGRSTFRELAHGLGTSISVVRYRFRRLLKEKVIIGFRAKIDHGKYGYEYYKIDVSLGERKHRQELINHILAHPNTTYYEESTGSSDIEFDVEVPDFTTLIAIMNKFRKNFKCIKDYHYYALVSLPHLHYVRGITEFHKVMTEEEEQKKESSQLTPRQRPAPSRDISAGG